MLNIAFKIVHWDEESLDIDIDNSIESQNSCKTHQIIIYHPIHIASSVDLIVEKGLSLTKHTQS